MNRYILALIASKEESATYISISQFLFKNLAKGYLLSEVSQPHVTVCQFRAPHHGEALALAKEAFPQEGSALNIRFTGLSFTIGLKEHEGYIWAALDVARESQLMEFHRKMVSILEKKELEVLNAHGDLYHPHLTLGRITLPFSLDSVDKALAVQSKDPFQLALGRGDENGQFLELISIL